MAKIGKVQEVAIADLHPYEKNAKLHSEAQVEKIAASIQEFGFISPCLIDTDGNIIAGHGRVMAAQRLGMTTVPCVYVEGLTEEQRRAYILADNKLTELGEWNMDLVSQELHDLKDDGFDINLTGFGIDDIIFTDMEDTYSVGEETEEEKEQIDVCAGDKWLLGRHTLLCGDSTNPEDIDRLVGDAVIDLLETDPLYNVNVESANGETIENDNLPDAEFFSFLATVFSNAAYHLKEGGAFYVWHADTNGLMFRQALEDAGLHIRQNLIWVKSHFTIGRQDYQWRHEPCLYGWKEGAAHYFIDLRSQDTVQEYELNSMSREQLVEIISQLMDAISTVQHEKLPAVDDLHPTMKPLSLIKKHVRNSSREGENVLDLFGGSGTTLIACEELNRTCYMMEYDPKYAQRIIRRWEEATGKKAVRLDA